MICLNFAKNQQKFISMFHIIYHSNTKYLNHLPGNFWSHTDYQGPLLLTTIS